MSDPKPVKKIAFELTTEQQEKFAEYREGGGEK